MNIGRVFSTAAVAVVGGTAIAVRHPAVAAATPLADGVYRFEFAGIEKESAPPCTPVSESFTAVRQADLPPGIEVPDPNTA